MEGSRNVQNLSGRFAKDSDDLVATTKRTVEHLGYTTNKCINERIAEITKVKRQLEKESVESSSAIKKMEQSLEIMVAQLDGNSSPIPRQKSKLSIVLQEPQK